MSPAPRRLFWPFVKLGIALLAVWFFAVPQLFLLRTALIALLGAPPLQLVVIALCALIALLAYAQLTRTMLGNGPRPGLLHTLGIITTSLGISNVVPAGSAVGSVVAFRMLERAGVGRARAGAALAATSLGSTAVLNVVLGVALVALIPLHVGAVGTGLAVPSLLTLVAVLLLGCTVLRRSPLLWSAAASAEGRVAALRGRLLPGLKTAAVVLQALRHDPWLVIRGLFWATVNWLVDALALWLVLRMVGAPVDPVPVLVAFALANLIAIVPLTPGGLGVVEFALTAILVGLGAPGAPTAIGIAAYRVFTYWLPIPGSALAYFATRFYTRGGTHPTLNPMSS